MNFYIREAASSDIPALCALERECFSSPWSEGAFSESMQSGNAHFLLCEGEGGEVLGYIGGIFLLDECTVTDVCTAEHARRQGIGEALLKQLEAECRARGAAHIFLEVRESNTAAIRLYERLGYERLGVRAGAYSKPRENAYSYGKTV